MAKRTQEEFIEHLRQSVHTVNKVAEWLRASFGYQVTILPNEESTTHEERMSFTDNGDVLIGMPVEIKQNYQYEWTGRDDFPFQNVTVMAKHAWDAKRPEPHSVIMVAKDGEHAVITKKETKEFWVEYEQVDCRDGQTQTVYQCPREHCIFTTITNK